MERYWEFGSILASSRALIFRTAPLVRTQHGEVLGIWVHSCLKEGPHSKNSPLLGPVYTLQVSFRSRDGFAEIYIRCQSDSSSTIPIGDQLGRSFFGLLFHSLMFRFFLSFFCRRISSFNGECRCSQNHKLQSQSARDKYKQLATAILFSLLNAII